MSASLATTATARDSLQSWGIAVLRVVIGFVFLMHGWQKFFQYGLDGVAGAFTQLGIPLPYVSAILAATAEGLGGLLLIFGLGTRFAAVPLAFTMLVAWLTAHRSGFFLPAGGEYAITLLGASVALVLTGPGKLALDNLVNPLERTGEATERQQRSFGAAPAHA
jgi:putative oxidoreductase